ncbi:expressed unknown protein [Seminavis robusta]|uniref:Uncharacterized protein n=1 Tax=Seminavis robusta TaxID=568900 RepID=A0A9N8HAD4_9STRA|nr:expressed unknown protein [Seminavis robusta]|eukprot:Sro238_g095480.1 n/a (647) ;mRNA; f:21689-23629
MTSEKRVFAGVRNALENQREEKQKETGPDAAVQVTEEKKRVPGSSRKSSTKKSSSKDDQRKKHLLRSKSMEHPGAIMPALVTPRRGSMAMEARTGKLSNDADADRELKKQSGASEDTMVDAAPEDPPEESHDLGVPFFDPIFPDDDQVTKRKAPIRSKSMKLDPEPFVEDGPNDFGAPFFDDPVPKTPAKTKRPLCRSKSLDYAGTMAVARTAEKQRNCVAEAVDGETGAIPLLKANSRDGKGSSTRVSRRSMKEDKKAVESKKESSKKESTTKDRIRRRCSRSPMRRRGSGIYVDDSSRNLRSRSRSGSPDARRASRSRSRSVIRDSTRASRSRSRSRSITRRGRSSSPSMSTPRGGRKPSVSASRSRSRSSSRGGRNPSLARSRSRSRGGKRPSLCASSSQAATQSFRRQGSLLTSSQQMGSVRRGLQAERTASIRRQGSLLASSQQMGSVRRGLQQSASDRRGSFRRGSMSCPSHQPAGSVRRDMPSSSERSTGSRGDLSLSSSSHHHHVGQEECYDDEDIDTLDTSGDVEPDTSICEKEVEIAPSEQVTAPGENNAGSEEELTKDDSSSDKTREKWLCCCGNDNDDTHPFCCMCGSAKFWACAACHKKDDNKQKYKFCGWCGVEREGSGSSNGRNVAAAKTA